ncbi:5' nucleotidase, NT5C type [Halonatronum saccharophilum]|uniref:5' nucleotidase, NT5C type n=1 Tax=Halonatronum saccharophilum TaxID=150060 RepID=UPI0004ADF44D|nr:hypothetical protein [Halonatronum saccharophilum]
MSEKMKKVIGVDIDAVLTDEGKGEDNIWHRNICDYFGLDGRKNNKYDFCEAYGLSLAEVEKFVEDRGDDIYLSVPPRPKCKEVLARLKEEGYKIILVTARPSKDNKVTLEWLKKNKIPYDKLFHSDEKHLICQKEKIKFFIDDHLKHLIPMLDLDMDLLLMDMDHNFDYEGKIKRVDNWGEIEEEIRRSFAD